MNCQLIEGFPRFLYQALQTGAISTPGTVTISARTFQLCPILFLFIHFILLSFYPTYRYLFYFFFFLLHSFLSRPLTFCPPDVPPLLSFSHSLYKQQWWHHDGLALSLHKVQHFTAVKPCV